MSRLPQFIRENTELILAEWDAFAAAVPSAAEMDTSGLHDHAREMLATIANDLDLPQTDREQTDKSKGQSDAGEAGPPTTAAQEHGAGRAEGGFTVAEMLSELRALRASVLRLWAAQQKTVTVTDLDDMTRFNEAIDQAIAESIAQFSDEISESKERFLAILGHDLRTPLGAVLMSATFMLDAGELTEPNLSLMRRIAGGARRMNHMVADLLEFTQSRFGTGIPVVRAEMDLSVMIHDVVEEIMALHPSASVRVAFTGDLHGQWDCARLTQAMTNLIGNAVQHGTRGTPIYVTAACGTTDIVITVRNVGAVIPAAEIATIFRAGTRSATATGSDNHLGLGLYIVKRIVEGHEGTISVTSTPSEGTAFVIHLPRAA